MAISLPLRGILAFLAFLISTGNGHFSSPPGDSSFLASSHFHRRWLFLFLSGGFLLSLLFSFPPEIPISPLFRGNHSFLALLLSTGNGHFSSFPGESSFIPTIHKNNQTTSATQAGFLMRPEGLTSCRYLPTASPEAYVTQRASSRAERRPTGRIKNKPARGGSCFPCSSHFHRRWPFLFLSGGF